MGQPLPQRLEPLGEKGLLWPVRQGLPWSREGLVKREGDLKALTAKANSLTLKSSFELFGGCPVHGIERMDVRQSLWNRILWKALQMLDDRHLLAHRERIREPPFTDEAP